MTVYAVAKDPVGTLLDHVQAVLYQDGTNRENAIMEFDAQGNRYLKLDNGTEAAVRALDFTTIFNSAQRTQILKTAALAKKMLMPVVAHAESQCEMVGKVAEQTAKLNAQRAGLSLAPVGDSDVDQILEIQQDYKLLNEKKVELLIDPILNNASLKADAAATTDLSMKGLGLLGVCAVAAVAIALFPYVGK